MDENRLKKVVQSALDNSFSGLTINEFRTLETNKMNDDGTWTPFSYTLFIMLRRGTSLNEGYSQTLQTHDVTHFLESLTGFECCVDFS
jgi:hypothetical protein